MIEETKKLIEIYGQNISVNLFPEDIVKNSKAFIQPLRSDYQSLLYLDYAESSKVEQYLYIGSAELELYEHPNSIIKLSDSSKYTIKKVEKVYLLSKAIYERAVLEKITT